MSRLPRRLPVLLLLSCLGAAMASRLASPPQSAAAPAESAPSAAGTALVTAGATWRYLDDGSDPGTGWRAAAFDDSSWAAGPAQLGYGDGDEATVVGYGPDLNAKYITTYFRYAFDLADASLYDALGLNLLRDDGAVVYLNGVEVYRSNLPAGAINYTTLAGLVVGGSEETAFSSAAVDPALLADGPNVLAVEIHQANGASSDISFDLSLLESEAPAHCTAPEVQFAVVGDFGVDSQSEQDVAQLVQGWNPDFVITTGDNNYPDGAADSIDANVGQYYHGYIGDYTGGYGPGASSNNFYPALGNHDWQTNSGSPAEPVPYLDYFHLPGNERYYNFTRGPVEMFAVDSDPREPNGISDDSAQAAWLQGALAASKAPWRLVYMHHPPYSSGPHGPTAELQWPYGGWGASAVLAGHDHSYERLSVNGLTYFVNGLGGASRYPLGPPISGSLFSYTDDFGAMRVEASATCLAFQFVARTGVVIDSYALSKESVYVPLVVRP